MFPSIDVFGSETAFEVLENKETDFSPAECVLVALRLFQECSNFVFNEKFWLQENGTTMKSHMPCPYSDIVKCRFDLSYTPKVLCWKTFSYYIFAVWNHSITLTKTL